MYIHVYTYIYCGRILRVLRQKCRVFSRKKLANTRARTRAHTRTHTHDTHDINALWPT